MKRTAGASIRAHGAAAARLLRSYPSTYLLPLLVLGLILGFGLWGVQRIAQAEEDSAQADAVVAAADAALQLQAAACEAVGAAAALASLVVAQPGFAEAVGAFDRVAPRLRAEAPAGAVRLLLLAPAGVVRAVFPGPDEEGLMGADLLNETVNGQPQSRAGALAAVRQRTGPALSGPHRLADGSLVLRSTQAVFVRLPPPGAAAAAAWRLPDAVNPACGLLCAPNASTGEAFWGVAAALVDVTALTRAPAATVTSLRAGSGSRSESESGSGSAAAALEGLAAQGYAYSLEASTPAPSEGAPREGGAEGASGAVVVVAASDPPPSGDPVSVAVRIGDTQWQLWVAPAKGGWRPAWLGGLVAAVVVVAAAVAALMAAALVVGRRQALLLQTLLPKHVIQDLAAGNSVARGERGMTADTPADMLLGMMRTLLEGGAPDLRDVVWVRTALSRNVDFYQPTNLRGTIKGANFDTDVTAALMRQLGAGGGADALSACSEDLTPYNSGPGDADGGGDDDSPFVAISRAGTNGSNIGGGGGGAVGSWDTLTGALTMLLAAPPPPPPLLASATGMYSPTAGVSAVVTATTAGGGGGGGGTEAGGLMVDLVAAEARAPSLLPSPLPSPRAGTPPPSGHGMLETRDSVLGRLRLPGGGGGGSGGGGSFTRQGSGRAGGGAGGWKEKADRERDRDREGSTVRMRIDAAAAAAAAAAGGGGGGGIRAESSLGGGSGSGLAGLATMPSAGRRAAAAAAAALSPSGASVGPPSARDPSQSQAQAHVTVPPPVIEEVERLLASADHWQFDTWRLAEATQGHPLSCLGFFLLHREGLMRTFKINPSTLARLLRAVEAGYSPTIPYHNSTHAADVLQTLHVLMHGTGLTAHYVDRLGLLAAYWAAIVHDHGHPGLTNDFLISTCDPLAVRYNDRSPLENHHCASSFALLLRPELDALAHFGAGDKAAFRKQVIEMVMATDMKQHFAFLSHFNTAHRLAAYSAAAANPSHAGGRPVTRPRHGAVVTAAAHGAASGGPPPPPDPAAPRPLDDAERMLSLQIALKVADIGHLGEDLDVHCRWLGVLEEEFFRQGDREAALGLPISPLFDRAKQGVSKSQVGFYDFVALPLAHALASAFPGAAPILDCFHANYDHWRAVEARAAAANAPAGNGGAPGAAGGPQATVANGHGNGNGNGNGRVSSDTPAGTGAGAAGEGPAGALASSAALPVARGADGAAGGGGGGGGWAAAAAAAAPVRRGAFASVSLAFGAGRPASQPSGRGFMARRSQELSRSPPMAAPAPTRTSTERVK
ncbi:hypothetical protein HYH03_008614 [Edaphochlamys debaryana]|uniref:Phosphodiesterase n=1 Tax=Edaphochlamys debaryana TaxID=47281 RepID=A0A836BZB2_9CHLO|nr:hypothetical protein HYH03_008614 [Edaphochlamys debaryana]|eukprot:KAG2493194.1 hypothetical protein HYH03_008614 [Edaphochlamys debaryana]